MKISGGEIRQDVGTGEGSRGGHIMGHTSSGKPIYSYAAHENHSNFTPVDHAEAAHLHQHLAKAQEGKDTREVIYHQANMAAHQKKALKLPERAYPATIERNKARMPAVGEKFKEKYPVSS